eukprot:scaffold25699_cov137-Cylindrotheca_fusiformis.AAC.3
MSLLDCIPLIIILRQIESRWKLRTMTLTKFTSGAGKDCVVVYKETTAWAHFLRLSHRHKASANFIQSLRTRKRRFMYRSPWGSSSKHFTSGACQEGHCSILYCTTKEDFATVRV